MTTPIKVGNLTPHRQRRTYTYDPENGDTFSEEYLNASEAQMFALAASYRSNRIPYQLTIENNHATLVTKDATGEYVLDTWQIENDELNPSSLVNPRNRALIALEVAGGVTAAALVLEDIGKVLNGEPATSGGTPLDYDGLKAYFTTHNMNASLRLLQRMQLGATNYFQARPVVRHTTNASNRYNWNISNVDVESIYTPSAFFSEAQSSGLWLFPMPNALSAALAAVPEPAVRSNYLWGYLKRPATVSTAANNRVDITTLYILDQWSTDEYETA